MKNIFKTLLTTAIMLGGIAFANAQTAVTPPYSCGFEDTEALEIAEWKLLNIDKNGIACNDKWYIGDAVAQDGAKSLYISNIGADTVHYGVIPNIVVAYREMTLPGGVYNVTFDWLNLASGKLGNYESGLMVCRIPKGDPLFDPYSDMQMKDLPMFLINKVTCRLPDGTSTQVLKGSRQWRNAQFSLTAQDNTPFYLVFVWVNIETQRQPFPIAAAVDNIAITAATCPVPYGLTIEGDCDRTTVKWEGTAGNYELDYRPYAQKDGWRKINVGNAKEWVFEDMIEGYYDFRVRGVCDNGNAYSNYSSLNGQLVFCPANHCINYIALGDPNVTTCYGAKVTNKTFVALNAPIDYGPDNQRSRHTVHREMDEYDQHTNYALRTIPTGEYGSVRLGNWSADELDRIEYVYSVDTMEAAVLLLKYAIVFEDPSHPHDQQPYFNLVILDAFGNVLDAQGCGQAEFYAGSSMNGWKTIPAQQTQTKRSPIVWKDWSTLGVNMRPFQGQTVRIQITVRDCDYQNGHYGYGYFTLGCAKGTIEGLSCGASEFMELEAPDGFDYEWTTSDDPGNVISRERIYKASASDTREYIVRCMYKEGNGCEFSLRTKVSPRRAKADFEVQHVAEDCENTVKIINRSHVVTKDEDGNDVDLWDDRISDIIWDFGDGAPVYETSPKRTVPDEGGQIRVKLHAALSGSDDGCSDDIDTIITVPSILTTPKDSFMTACFGEGVQWGDKNVGVDSAYYVPAENRFVYPDTVVNRYGCDSVNILHLRVLPRIDVKERWDTICFEGVFDEVDGYELTTDGTHRCELTTANDCDSVIVVHLTVMPEMTWSATHKDEQGSPNSGEITLDIPADYSWALNGTLNAPLTGLNGGSYLLTVYDKFRCAQDTTIEISSECLDITFDLSNTIGCVGDLIIELPCEYNAGVLSTYSILFGESAKEAGFTDVIDEEFDGESVAIAIPDSCRPNDYDARLVITDVICENDTLHLPFAIHYDADIVRQKWMNVLAVLNDRYNGGYEFAAYQWYKNGMPIANAQGSYYYIGENEALDTSAEYHVMLTRVDDGISMPSCPMIPELNELKVSDYPILLNTMLQVAQRVEVKNLHERMHVRVYDVTGRLMSSGFVDIEENEIVMPYTAGVYLVMIGEKPWKVIVR